MQIFASSSAMLHEKPHEKLTLLYLEKFESLSGIEAYWTVLTLLIAQETSPVQKLCGEKNRVVIMKELTTNVKRTLSK